jgi:hypothetical protein
MRSLDGADGDEMSDCRGGVEHAASVANAKRKIKERNRCMILIKTHSLIPNRTFSLCVDCLLDHAEKIAAGDR